MDKYVDSPVTAESLAEQEARPGLLSHGATPDGSRLLQQIPLCRIGRGPSIRCAPVVEDATDTRNRRKTRSTPSFGAKRSVGIASFERSGPSIRVDWGALNARESRRTGRRWSVFRTT